ncbi:MAG: cytochrome P450 [Sphingomonas fennica]
MTCPYTPPYPVPPARKPGLVRRFRIGWDSWIHTLFARSYTMMLGETHLPRVSIYIANDPAIVHRVLDEVRDADDGNPPTFPKHWMINSVLDPLIGTSVFNANGQTWEDQRRMVNPAFQHTHLKTAFPLMQAAVEAMATRLAAAAATGAPVHIDPLMTHVAGDIIYRTLFSAELDAAGARAIFEAFDLFQRQMQPSITLRIFGLPGFGYRRRAERAAAAIHAVFAPVVRARHDAYVERGDAGPDDILHSLLRARHPQTGAPFTFRELIDQISTIFLAGHETSASAMTWALYILAACPDIQQALRTEAEAAAAATATIDFAALKALPRTRNVFRETLRLYPPVSFLLRGVTAPVRFRDKLLKPGAMVAVSPWLMQRNPDRWACPHSFDPDRFARGDEADAIRTAYLPFGRGPRICIGAGYAQQEALLLLATIVRRFRLETVPGDVPEPVSRLTLRPRHGVRLIVTEIASGDAAAACA